MTTGKSQEKEKKACVSLHTQPQARVYCVAVQCVAVNAYEHEKKRKWENTTLL